MMKLLYITFANDEVATGGGQCASRNLESLQIIFGINNVEKYIIRPQGSRNLSQRIDRALGVVKGYMGGLTDAHLRNIMNMLDEGHFTDVFIDNSQLGNIAKCIALRHKNIRIFTFFHNVEYDYMRSVTIQSGDYKHAFWMYGAKKNEINACRYSHAIIALNNSDSDRLKELYNRNADGIIPISMKDNYHDIDDSDNVLCSTGHKEAFFLGSYFAGNTKGLKWFCDDILPDVNIHLTIVGAGMDKFAKEITNSNQITLHSYVDDLSTFYENADFVLLPIISGGGMKVKTAESLKYGKYIIGTKEALEGYEVNESIATICNSKDEFVKAINSFSRPYKYNSPSRSLFKAKYSFDTSLSLFKKLIQR